MAFNIQPAKASGTIYIRADGSIEPPTANITSLDNITYTFTDNNYDEIVVERNNIVVDGIGYTLQGTGAHLSKGIDLTGRSNVTIKNIEIKAFDDSIRLHSSSNNSIIGNNIKNNIYGIKLYESLDNFICHNNFINNNLQVDSSDSVNVWDDGYPSGGNYWSNYNGTDTNQDGIGDTPYVIDGNNQDNYPIMSPWNPMWSPKPPVEEIPFWMQWWFYAVVIAGIAVLAGAIYFLKKRKPPTPAPTPSTEGNL